MMRWIGLILVGVTVVCAVTPDMALGQVENIFDEDTNGRWNNRTLWSLERIPEGTDHVIIPGTSRCRIPVDYTLAVAQKITVQENGALTMNEGSVLDVAQDLTLEDNADMVMEVALQQNSHLKVLTGQIIVGADATFLMKEKEETGGVAKVEAQSINVKEDGEMLVELLATLTLGNLSSPPNTSTVKGLLVIGGPDSYDEAYLVIAEDHTIKGAGGTVFVQEDSFVQSPDGEDHTLTLASDCTGAQTPPCAVVMRGGGHIEVSLINDAIVQADLSQQDPMHLEDEAKQGSGMWWAKGGGALWVETEVTGSATWVLSDPGGSSPRIWIKAPLSLEGDVVIKAGFFLLEETFCTTGDLTWDSTDDQSTIKFGDVDEYAWAMFGVCSNCCP